MVFGGYKENMKLGWRIWLLVVILSFSIIAIIGIPPKFLESGVIVTDVNKNSTLFEQGLRNNQIITAIDGKPIKNSDDYVKSFDGKFTSVNEMKTIITTSYGEFVELSSQEPDLSVSNIPKTNLKLGLDLAGGAKALVKAQDFQITSEDAQQLSDIIKNRLNVYGLEDIKVNPISDLSGNNFVRIEIAGATPDDLESLVSQQGKFEAKIGNDTVFIGGEKDIASVARSGQEAVVESCQQSPDGSFFCNFRFTVFLSPGAAQKHADITQTLEANFTSNGENYLSQKLDLYLDDKLVDSLLISEGLKGHVTTQISISGSGNGATQNEAIKSAEENMKKLQT